MGRKGQALISNFTEDEDNSTRTTALQISATMFCLITPTCPPTVLFLVYRQWFACILSAFWFYHQGVWASEGNGYASVYLQPKAYALIHVWCLCMLTQRRDHVSINFSVLIHASKEETIFYLQNTQWHQQITHPFHLLPLVSVTPASMPCVMDFQMQVRDFFQGLTGIFLCVRDEDQDLSGSLQIVLLKDSACRNRN